MENIIIKKYIFSDFFPSWVKKKKRKIKFVDLLGILRFLASFQNDVLLFETNYEKVIHEISSLTPFFHY